MESLPEIWKPAVGFEGKYEVSNRGQVRSIDREVDHGRDGTGHGKRKLQGVLLRQRKQGSGYRSVGLPLIGGKQKCHLVHWLVAAAFIGRRPDGADINHKDGNKANNCAQNLEYCTRRENMVHARATGLWDNRGERNGQAKKTEAAVLAILADSERMTRRQLRDKHGVTRQWLENLLSGRKWKHLTQPKEAVCSA